MSKSKTPSRRRHYFVKKDYQFKFILKFCLLVVIGAMISTGLLFLLSRGTLTTSFQQSRLVIKNTAVAIFPAVIYTNLITIVLITIATIFVTLFVSHKLAGPMFRFEKELEEIGKGDLTKKIMLREKDQLKDMGESLNKMIEGLHDKVLAAQTELEHIIDSAAKQNAPGGLIQELNHLHQNIGSSFKI